VPSQPGAVKPDVPSRMLSSRDVLFTFFPKDLVFRYAYSKDGTQIAIERGNIESDAFLFYESAK
jgi:hypothetical protein